MAVTTLTPEQVRQWRDALGMTQAQLAKALYVDEDQVWRWETGRSGLTQTRLAQLDDLAKRLKTPLPS